MDKMIYFTGHYQRQINYLPQVSDFGYLYNKKETVYQTFNSCNFSFILKGDGFYMHKGNKLRVQAPAILIQSPGEPNNYGPETTWDEYFIMYKASYFSDFIKAGLLNPDKPVIPLSSFKQSKELLSDIVQLFNSGLSLFPSDKLDLLCWRLLNETPLFSGVEDQQSETDNKINSVANIIKKDPLLNYDFKDLAKNIGMALPTFRRHWLKTIGVPPARFIADLKLGIACDLLIKSDKPIYEIAIDMKFNDSLYFSRFFSKKTGYSPKEYRNKFRFR